MSDDLLDPNRDETQPDTDGPTYPVVGDEQNVAQKRTHQRVQAIMDEITNVRVEEARDVENEIPEYQHRTRYHKTVCELWRELEPTLDAANEDTKLHYRYEVDLGDVTVNPPRPLTQPAGRIEREQRPMLKPGASWATPKKEDITGFADYLEANAVMTARFEVRFDADTITSRELERRIAQADPGGQYRVWPHNNYDDPFRVDKQILLPERIIDKARRELRTLAEKAEIGFGKPDAIGSEETEPV
jgi:hypothetical protein